MFVVPAPVHTCPADKLAFTSCMIWPTISFLAASGYLTFQFDGRPEDLLGMTMGMQHALGHCDWRCGGVDATPTRVSFSSLQEPQPWMPALQTWLPVSWARALTWAG